MSARVACPMCGQPLDRSSVEEVNIEFSTLNSCGKCGFGLDLRWRGRGSVFARPTPDLLIVSPLLGVAQRFMESLPVKLVVDQVGDPTEALGVCAQAIRRDTPLRALIVLHRGECERWTDVAVAVRSLEEGFRVSQPLPIWYMSSADLTLLERELFTDLSEIYWHACGVDQEITSLLEMAPQLFQ